MRTDFYTQPHKWQRQVLFELSKKVGVADFTDTAVRSAIQHDLTLMTTALRQHAWNEETFVHPLLSRKIPHAKHNFEQEHVEVKQHLAGLETSYDYLEQLSPHYEKLQQHGLEFYRALNRFIARYLTHINEEEYVMQNLWEVCSEPELKGIMIAFQTYDGQEKDHKWLERHLMAMSEDEQQLLFKSTQLMVPCNIFTKMCELTEKILGVDRWKQISIQLT